MTHSLTFIDEAYVSKADGNSQTIRRGLAAMYGSWFQFLFFGATLSHTVSQQFCIGPSHWTNIPLIFLWITDTRTVKDYHSLITGCCFRESTLSNNHFHSHADLSRGNLHPYISTTRKPTTYYASGVKLSPLLLLIMFPSPPSQACS